MKVELEGTTRIRDLESEFGIEIPTDAGFENAGRVPAVPARPDSASGAIGGLRRAALYGDGDGAEPDIAGAGGKDARAAGGVDG